MNSTSTSSPPHNPAQRRAWWLRTLTQWHWVSAALSLVCMMLYAATGITLNNSAHIAATPEVVTREAQLPARLLTLLAGWDARALAPGDALPLPAAVVDWLAQQFSLDVRGREVDWSPDEVYVNLPRPGGDGWLRIDRESGAVEVEITRRGWVAYFNDLHKGRHTGLAWRWLIDFFAAACLLFAATGLAILKMHAARRPATWPLFGLGVVIPVVLALIIVH